MSSAGPDLGYGTCCMDPTLLKIHKQALSLVIVSVVRDKHGPKPQMTCRSGPWRWSCGRMRPHLTLFDAKSGPEKAAVSGPNTQTAAMVVPV